MNRNKLLLHLGVHKTATTHFQSRLFNSISSLQEVGVSYLGLEQTRKLITSKLFWEGEIEKKLCNFFNQNEFSLISDENIIGGTDKIKNELIYSDVVNRLKSLLDKLPVDLFAVHLTIRDPESYLISRYCEYLRHYRFMSVSEYFDNFSLKSFSWLPLIHAIEMAAGKKVQVTLFEDIFNDENAYLKKLTSVDINFAKASEGASIRRSKISLESYRILEHLADHYPRHMTQRLVNMMDNNQQRTKSNPLEPFSPELSRILKENYEADKKALGLV